WALCRCQALAHTNHHADLLNRLARAPPSSGAIRPIAGVSEARQDIGVLIERIIDGGSPNPHVRMEAAQALETLRRPQQTDQPHLPRAALLQPIDGGN